MFVDVSLNRSDLDLTGSPGSLFVDKVRVFVGLLTFRRFADVIVNMPISY